MDDGEPPVASQIGRHRHADGSPRTRQDVPLLVVLGRAALALVPVLWATAYLTRPIWADAPLADGIPDHPLAVVYFVTSLVVGTFVPWLLLPVGPSAGTSVDPAGVLTVVTVLGRRRLETDRLARIGTLTVSGRGSTQYYLYLRDSRFRWVLVSMGKTPRLSAPLRHFVEAVVDERPDVLTARARTALRLGARPGLAQRLALGTFSVVVGTAVSGTGMILAWALVLAGWMPLT